MSCRVLRRSRNDPDYGMGVWEKNEKLEHLLEMLEDAVQGWLEVSSERGEKMNQRKS